MGTSCLVTGSEALWGERGYYKRNLISTTGKICSVKLMYCYCIVKLNLCILLYRDTNTAICIVSWLSVSLQPYKTKTYNCRSCLVLLLGTFVILLQSAVNNS